jgi:hypothetical protein
MRDRSVSVREVPDGHPDISRPNLTQATEILIELVNPDTNVVRWARLTLLDENGNIVIMNRSASQPMRLRARVHQTLWPSGENIMFTLADVSLPCWI